MSEFFCTKYHFNKLHLSHLNMFAKQKLNYIVYIFLISLITGEVIEGNLTFVSKSASTSTRTFKVESQIQNKDGIVRDGITAEMIIKTKFVKAHKISPSILILNDNGKIGVRSVIDGVVVFHNVSILEDSESGLWITDIPDSLDLIVQGQGFVEDGQQVVINQI